MHFYITNITVDLNKLNKLNSKIGQNSHNAKSFKQSCSESQDCMKTSQEASQDCNKNSFIDQQQYKHKTKTQRSCAMIKARIDIDGILT